MNLNTKTKIAICFQPYLIVALLGLFGAYGQFTNSANKYVALIGMAIFVSNFTIYSYLLFKKAFVIRSFDNMLIIGLGGFFNGLGHGNYNMGVTSSILLASCFLLLYLFDFKLVRNVVNTNEFTKQIKEKPEMLIFFDDSILSMFTRNKKTDENNVEKKGLFNRKMKFSDEKYTYINNDIVFDNKGIKGTNYSFEDVKKYMEDSFLTIKDFNKDSFKTIEMLKY